MNRRSTHVPVRSSAPTLTLDPMITPCDSGLLARVRFPLLCCVLAAVFAFVFLRVVFHVESDAIVLPVLRL